MKKGGFCESAYKIGLDEKTIRFGLGKRRERERAPKLHSKVAMADSDSQLRASQRLATIVRHLAPEASPSESSLTRLTCLGNGARKPSSYERVHGKVSRELPVWVSVPLPSGQEEFRDILYEKSASEGIAKVSLRFFWCRIPCKVRNVRSLQHCQQYFHSSSSSSSR